MDVAAVLLAGGRSVRMGRDKPLLEIAGETLVERHVRQLRAIGVHNIVLVSNAANRRAICEHTELQTMVQRGHGMSAAVRTGLDAASGFDAVFLVCVNDLILDEDYGALGRTTVEEGLVIPTGRLDRVFHGGMLQLAGDEVRGIVEKPDGGCPAGAVANIMIHRVAGARTIRDLRNRLRSACEYEAAINAMIAAGLRALAVPVAFWLAIKNPEDYREAERRLSRNPGEALRTA